MHVFSTYYLILFDKCWIILISPRMYIVGILQGKFLLNLHADLFCFTGLGYLLVFISCG